ncbi:uncharacterized protein LOC121837295, partial [Ixodes scapularis]|uniref:uncharacterized protein LOC121837295 n=1 Tax=Ixodes scapularis TaxID=6945 RepID=UPI001C386048
YSNSMAHRLRALAHRFGTRVLSKTKILGVYKSRFGREILESLHIKSFSLYLSSPSVFLSDREIHFLWGERAPLKLLGAYREYIYAGKNSTAK